MTSGAQRSMSSRTKVDEFLRAVADCGGTFVFQLFAKLSFGKSCNNDSIQSLGDGTGEIGRRENTEPSAGFKSDDDFPDRGDLRKG